MNTCKFCQENKDRLEISHIIPKFFFKWIKKTGTTGRLRTGINIKKPVQDGLKVPLLCSECEINFSAFETYFANKIFSQMTKNNGVIKHSSIDWMKFNQFISSLLWRTLHYQANNESHNKEYFKKEIIEFNKCALKIKRAFEKQDTIPFNTFFIPLNDLSVKNEVIEIEDYAYFERSVSANLIVDDANNHATTIYIKIPFALIVCEILNCNKHNWVGLKISDKCDFNSTNVTIPKHVQNYLKHNCNQCYEMSAEIPEHQNIKIINKLNENPNNIDGTKSAMIRNKNRKINL